MPTVLTTDENGKGGKVMKRSMEKLKIGLLAGFMVCTAGFAVSTAGVWAEPVATQEFAMQSGASVYLPYADEGTGLRFTATVDDLTFENYGMIIAPYDYFTAAGVEFTGNEDYIAMLEAANKTYNKKENMKVASDGTIKYSVVNILENNVDRDFIGVAFKDNGGTYEYAEVSADNRRSISLVASRALNADIAGETDDSTSAAIAENKTVLENYVKNAVKLNNGGSEEFTLEISGETAVTAGDSFELNLSAGLAGKIDARWSDSASLLIVSEDGEITASAGGITNVTADIAGLYSATKKVYAAEPEEGVVAYFHKSYGIYDSDAVSSNAVKKYITDVDGIEGENKHSLYTEGEGWPIVQLKAPFITNLNEKDGSGEYKYNYLYFWAKANNANTKIGINRFDQITLQNQIWTRVVAERSGETFLVNGKNIFESTDSRFTSTADNLTNFAIGVTFNSYAAAWFSSIRAVKTLPSLENDLLLPFNYGFGEALMGTSGAYSASFSNTVKYENEEWSYKLSLTSDAINGYASMGNVVTGAKMIKSPLINDISAYKHIYFYVYSPDVNIRIYGEGAATVWDSRTNIQKGVWTRVSFTNTGTSWWLNNGSVLETEASKNMSAAKFGLRFFIAGEDNNNLTSVSGVTGIYVSAIRVANDLPA